MDGERRCCQLCNSITVELKASAEAEVHRTVQAETEVQTQVEKTAESSGDAVAEPAKVAAAKWLDKKSKDAV